MYRLQGRASDTQTGAGTHDHKLSPRHTNTQSHRQTDRKCDQETYKKNRIKVRETDKQLGKQANRQ